MTGAETDGEFEHYVSQLRVGLLGSCMIDENNPSRSREGGRRKGEGGGRGSRAVGWRRE